MHNQNSVLIVGSSGFLGRCLVDRLRPHARVTCTHHHHPAFSHSLGYNFFQDDIRPLIERTGVTTVIFAAMVEREEPESIALAMTLFVRSCHDLRVVYLSSDGIFCGETGLYKEQDTPVPHTRYGHNLLTCETLVKEHCANFCIIRPSYIYGFSQGRLDPRLAHIRQKLLLGERVEMFHNMYKSPLGIEQVADAVITLMRSDYRGIVHVAGERLSTFEFARQAMGALSVESTHLIPCPMPVQSGFLRDTSLDTTLWQALTGTRPLTIRETLSCLTEQGDVEKFKVFALFSGRTSSDAPLNFYIR